MDRVMAKVPLTRCTALLLCTVTFPPSDSTRPRSVGSEATWSFVSCCMARTTGILGAAVVVVVLEGCVVGIDKDASTARESPRLAKMTASEVIQTTVAVVPL